MEEPQPERPRQSRWLADFARYSGIGFEFFVTLLLCGGLGWLADGWLGMQDRLPLMLILGVLLGMLVGILRLQRMFPTKPK